jgi:HlyD family secretion protein
MNARPERSTRVAHARRHPRPVSLIAASAVLALVVAGSGCAPNVRSAGERAGASAGDGTALRRASFERALLLTGSLEAVRSIDIKAPQTSVFQMRIQYMAEEGRSVERGDRLVDFDNTFFVDQVEDLESRILDAEMQIVSKRNELASALKDLEIELAEKRFAYRKARLEADIDPEVVARREYEDRLFRRTKAAEELRETRERIALTKERGAAEIEVLEIDEAKLRKDLLQAQTGLELMSVEAPADGLVVYEQRPRTTLRYQEGDSCWPGTTVIRLPDLSEMRVVFDVNEVDVPHLRAGMPIKVRLDAFPGQSIDGRIVEIPSMAVKRDEGSDISVVRVVAELAETWVGEMRPGMSAMGRAVVERRDDVLLVPRDALRREAERWIVTAPDGSERQVRVVARNALAYVVEEPSDGPLPSAPARGPR